MGTPQGGQLDSLLYSSGGLSEGAAMAPGGGLQTPTWRASPADLAASPSDLHTPERRGGGGGRKEEEVEGVSSVAVLKALHALQDRCWDLETEKKELQGRLQVAETLVAEAGSLCEDVRRAAGAQSADEREEATHTMSRQALALLQETVTALTLRHQAEIEEVRRAEGWRLDVVQRELQEKERMLLEETRRVDQLRESYIQAGAGGSATEEENRRLRIINSDLEAQIASHKRTAQHLEEQLQSLQVEGSEMESRTVSLEQSMVSAQRAKGVAEEKVLAANRHADLLSSELEASKRHASTALARVKELEARNKDLNAQIARAGRKISALNVDNRRLQESLSKVLIINDDLLCRNYNVRLTERIGRPIASGAVCEGACDRPIKASAVEARRRVSLGARGTLQKGEGRLWEPCKRRLAGPASRPRTASAGQRNPSGLSTATSRLKPGTSGRQR